MRYFLKIFFGELIKIYHAKILGYYTSIDKIPIYNWDKVVGGEYKYLFKKRIGKVPSYFNQIVETMFYQLELVNMDSINERLNIAYVRSLYVTTKNKKYFNQANFMQAALDKKLEKNHKKSTLNEQINFIETTFNSLGAIDKHKMDAQSFYSKLNLAIKRNEELASRHGNN